MNEEIGKLLAKVEQLGADGNVEESQKVMDEVEKARAKKREAEVICCLYICEFIDSSFQMVLMRGDQIFLNHISLNNLV